MRKLSQTTLASRRKRSLLLAVVPALAAGALLAASAVPAQAAPAVRPFITGVFENYSTGMCLGLGGGHGDADAVVWRCNGASNQTWAAQTPTASEHITNGIPGQCLGVAGGSTGEGADVVGWTCQSAARNQDWEFGTVQPCYHDYSNDPYYPIFNSQTGYVVGVAGGSTKEGAHVITWRYQNTCNNQYWTLI